MFIHRLLCFVRGSILPIAFCCVACLVSSKEPDKEGGTEQKRKLLIDADIAFEEVIQGPSDEKITAQSLKGRPVVLEFWATWCAPCVIAIPHLNELAAENTSKGIQFVAVSADDSSAPVKTLL